MALTGDCRGEAGGRDAGTGNVGIGTNRVAWINLTKTQWTARLPSFRRRGRGQWWQWKGGANPAGVQQTRRKVQVQATASSSSEGRQWWWSRAAVTAVVMLTWDFACLSPSKSGRARRAGSGQFFQSNPPTSSFGRRLLLRCTLRNVESSKSGSGVVAVGLRQGRRVDNYASGTGGYTAQVPPWESGGGGDGGNGSGRDTGRLHGVHFFVSSLVRLGFARGKTPTSSDDLSSSSVPNSRYFLMGIAGTYTVPPMLPILASSWMEAQWHRHLSLELAAHPRARPRRSGSPLRARTTMPGMDGWVGGLPSPVQSPREGNLGLYIPVDSGQSRSLAMVQAIP